MESASKRSRNNLGRMKCVSTGTVDEILRRLRDNPEILAGSGTYKDAVASTFGLKHLLSFIFTVSVVRPRVPFEFCWILQFVS